VCDKIGIHELKCRICGQTFLIDSIYVADICPECCTKELNNKLKHKRIK